VPCGGEVLQGVDKGRVLRSGERGEPEAAAGHEVRCAPNLRFRPTTVHQTTWAGRFHEESGFPLRGGYVLVPSHAVFCQAILPEFNHFRGRESFSI